MNEGEVEVLVYYIDMIYGKLDILVNNVGIMYYVEVMGVNFIEMVKVEVLREIFDVNFFGLVSLI